jgi:cysteinyl-tRNA synthetase
MSTRYLGKEFDIHTSGTDLIFPHNENEVAQCEALYGTSPARYWIHSDLVYVDGKKMSRSAGNAVTLQDLLGLGYTGREVRYLLLATHYRQPLSYSREKLEEARSALRRIDSFVWRLQKAGGRGSSVDVKEVVNELVSSFEAAMDMDLNVPKALGALFGMIRRMNPPLARGELSKEDASKILRALEKINPALAILDFQAAGSEAEDPEIEALVREREEARDRKDYKEADRIRKKLSTLGVVLEDTPQGTLYRVQKDTGNSV